MATDVNEKHDTRDYDSRGSDSDHQQQNEKAIARPLDDPLGTLNSVPDPDEGLSEEEREKLVRDANIPIGT